MRPWFGLAVPKIVVLAMRRRHHCGLKLSSAFPREDKDQDESHFLLPDEDHRGCQYGSTLVLRSRMYPLSDV